MVFVVTGGAGFIGSNIVAKLLELNHEVSVIDNFHTGNEQNLSKVKHKIKIHKSAAGDIANLGIQNPEVIFHYGIASSTPMYKQNVHLVGSAISEFISLLE